MTNSTTSLLRVATVACTVGLVIASTGFNALFAFKIGITHGQILAGLSVLMAVALEGVKPLAVNACFNAVRSFHVVRCALIGLLGVMAIAYSLTVNNSIASAIASQS